MERAALLSERDNKSSEKVGARVAHGALHTHNPPRLHTSHPEPQLPAPCCDCLPGRRRIDWSTPSAANTQHKRNVKRRGGTDRRTSGSAPRPPTLSLALIGFDDTHLRRRDLVGNEHTPRASKTGRKREGRLGSSTTPCAGPGRPFPLPRHDAHTSSGLEMKRVLTLASWNAADTVLTTRLGSSRRLITSRHIGAPSCA